MWAVVNTILAFFSTINSIVLLIGNPAGAIDTIAGVLAAFKLIFDSIRDDNDGVDDTMRLISSCFTTTVASFLGNFSKFVYYYAHKPKHHDLFNLNPPAGVSTESDASGSAAADDEYNKLIMETYFNVLENLKSQTQANSTAPNPGSDNGKSEQVPGVGGSTQERVDGLVALVAEKLGISQESAEELPPIVSLIATVQSLKETLSEVGKGKGKVPNKNIIAWTITTGIAGMASVTLGKDLGDILAWPALKLFARAPRQMGIEIPLPEHGHTYFRDILETMKSVRPHHLITPADATATTEVPPQTELPAQPAPPGEGDEASGLRQRNVRAGGERG